jgi:hypothetical protein
VTAVFFFSACTNPSAPPSKPLTKEEEIQQNIDTLKAVAENGDLITRMNDNLISFNIKSLNPTDKSFSHAGVVTTVNGQKMVCNIDAGPKGMDTVRYDPIDSFINPKQNYNCALFRYELAPAERDSFLRNLDHFHNDHAHFDHVFDLGTDSLVYCSEMISKSLTRATNGRISFKEIPIPKHMLPLMEKFFQDQAPGNQLHAIVTSRKYVPIDELYLRPDCHELMRFPLKYFPGQ